MFSDIMVWWLSIQAMGPLISDIINELSTVKLFGYFTVYAIVIMLRRVLAAVNIA